MKVSKLELERRLSFARSEAAQAWTQPKTKKKVIDVTLTNEFAKILVGYMYRPNLGCATTGELLDEIKARVDLNYSTIKGG